MGEDPHSPRKRSRAYDRGMPKRRIPAAEGLAALSTWAREGTTTPRPTLLTAVRFTLEEIGALHPGRSVEVRVPPAGAVQILPGTTHRRGTPPAVVETTMETWLGLVTGAVTWEEAAGDGRVQASGERADLSPYFPFLAPRVVP